MAALKKKKLVQKTMFIHEDTLRQLRDLADQLGLSVAATVRMCIKAGLPRVRRSAALNPEAELRRETQ